MDILKIFKKKPQSSWDKTVEIYNSLSRKELDTRIENRLALTQSLLRDKYNWSISLKKIGFFKKYYAICIDRNRLEIDVKDEEADRKIQAIRRERAKEQEKDEFKINLDELNYEKRN